MLIIKDIYKNIYKNFQEIYGIAVTDLLFFIYIIYMI